MAAGEVNMNMRFPTRCPQIPHSLTILCFVLMSSSCTDEGTAPDEDWLADHSGISDPARRWQACAIEDYSMLQSQFPSLLHSPE